MIASPMTVTLQCFNVENRYVLNLRILHSWFVGRTTEYVNIILFFFKNTYYKSVEICNRRTTPSSFTTTSRSQKYSWSVWTYFRIQIFYIFLVSKYFRLVDWIQNIFVSLNWHRSILALFFLNDSRSSVARRLRRKYDFRTSCSNYFRNNYSAYCSTSSWNTYSGFHLFPTDICISIFVVPADSNTSDSVTDPILTWSYQNIRVKYTVLFGLSSFSFREIRFCSVFHQILTSNR